MMSRRERERGRWQVVQTATGEWHIVPTEDARRHQSTSACWCQPAALESVVATWVHNARERAANKDSNRLEQPPRKSTT